MDRDHHDHEEEINVPSYFLCPISLQIMKDPITISTGITYDRESIETWIFTNNNPICPVTKQPLNVDTNNIDAFLTPNHTLRRLIQSRCTLNASYGIERFPTPKSPITKAQISKLIKEASKSSTQRRFQILDTIKSISSESSANKRCLETTPGVAEFLGDLVLKNISEDALRILVHLQISDEMILRNLLKQNEGELINSLVKIIEKRNYDSRAYAIELMKQLLEVADPKQVVSLKREQFAVVIGLIRDEISPKTTKTALKVLDLACSWGRNRIRVTDAGAIPVMVDVLMESKDKRTIEMVLAVLDSLSGCAEGRAELLAHGAGLAVVSKKILRVSHFATEKGVKILFAICKFCGIPSLVQEMLQLGVVAKLCLVLQVDCEAKTKGMVNEILKLHSQAWINSRCTPSHIFGILNLVE